MRKFLVILAVLLFLASACGSSSPRLAVASPVAPEELSSIIYQHPSEVDNSFLPITPIEDIHTTGQPIEVDIDQYQLVIDGLVEQPLALTYEEILSRPQTTQVVLLICPGFFWDNAQWTGTPLAALLEEAGLEEGAGSVQFYALDGYQVTLPLQQALSNGVFLAYKVDGQTLPPQHGFPLRLVVPGEYGSEWIKWLERIQVTT